MPPSLGLDRRTPLPPAAHRPNDPVNKRYRDLVDIDTARKVACSVHADQMTRFGEPLIDHVDRVARAVPDEARALAYLHDALERSDMTCNALRAYGLTAVECSALKLLTRDAGESYTAYVERIAHAPGVAGRFARTVKVADLDDHLRHRITTHAPDYAWARAVIVDSQERHHEQRPRGASGG